MRHCHASPLCTFAQRDNTEGTTHIFMSFVILDQYWWGSSVFLVCSTLPRLLMFCKSVAASRMDNLSPMALSPAVGGKKFRFDDVRALCEQDPAVTQGFKRLNEKFDFLVENRVPQRLLGPNCKNSRKSWKRELTKQFGLDNVKKTD